MEIYIQKKIYNQKNTDLKVKWVVLMIAQEKHLQDPPPSFLGC